MAVDGTGSDAVTIRRFESRDRERVRHICYVTGYMGEPADWMWRDQESFADLFSSYYTDLEPESALVAEEAGEVAGYLLGCVDTRLAPSPARIFFRQVLLRGIAMRPGTAGFVWRSIADGIADSLRGRALPVPVKDDRWPAHLHIDLLPSIRGRGVGARLMRRWLEALREAKVPGCHLETLGENTRAIAFFESMGFERWGSPKFAPGLRSPAGARHTVQVLVQSL